METEAKYQTSVYSSPNFSQHISSAQYMGLVLSSGATKGVVQLGILHRLYQLNNLSSISVYGGSSIGSVINLLLVAGYSPLEIFSNVCTKNIFQINKDQLQLSKMIPRILSSGGGLVIDPLFTPIESLIMDKFGTIPSLLELYQATKKHFICATYNMTLNKMEYISHKTHPELSCIDAVKMSCSIPLLFEKFQYNDCLYIDGALCDSFPVSAVEEYCSKNIESNRRILGVNIYGHSNLGGDIEKEFEGWESIQKTIELCRYIHEIVNIPIYTNNQKSIHLASPNTDIISVSLNESNFSLSIPRQKLFDFFSIGTKTVGSIVGHDQEQNEVVYEEAFTDNDTGCKKRKIKTE
jgi:Predicted esterase of the alpha-beta hydrolase superfamily